MGRVKNDKVREEGKACHDQAHKDINDAECERFHMNGDYSKHRRTSFACHT